MRIPMFLKQFDTPLEMNLFAHGFCESHGLLRKDIVLWEQHLIFGVNGDMTHVGIQDGFDTKVVLYSFLDGRDNDYELKAWSDKVRLFSMVKELVLLKPFYQVAGEYLRRRGVDDVKAALEGTGFYNERFHTPKCFVDRGIDCFESMCDFESYIRKCVVSDRIFDALDVENTIFRRFGRSVA